MASGEGILFEGLKSLVFYDQRFAKPLVGAYGGSELAPHTYLSRLFARIPPQNEEEAAKFALLRIINECEHCPSPKDVRAVLADAVLKTQQLDFSSLYEKAKLFLAFPPKTADAAEEWINKVIYTSIRYLGRDRFMLVAAEDWATTVTDVIFGEVELCRHEPQSQEPMPPKRHDFKKLLDPKK